MNISKEFQGFFFGTVCPQLRKGAIERFKKTGKGMGYAHPYTNERVYFDMRNVEFKAVYHFLKLVNPNYPKDETGLTPLSTTKLDSKTMTEHIHWIERWAGLNGIELQYIRDEWDRLLIENGINKG